MSTNKVQISCGYTTVALTARATKLRCHQRYFKQHGNYANPGVSIVQAIHLQPFSGTKLDSALRSDTVLDT
jgi:hypothetical protein